MRSHLYNNSSMYWLLVLMYYRLWWWQQLRKALAPFFNNAVICLVKECYKWFIWEVSPIIDKTISWRHILQSGRLKLFIFTDKEIIRSQHLQPLVGFPRVNTVIHTTVNVRVQKYWFYSAVTAGELYLCQNYNAHFHEMSSR